ncbi:SMP-30/gluconolactonase/LRE family protein [Haladaptatus sp. ZSTT2]|uniref:SMP-30/gluconolactonase/LRE family protein n=1 Tax=Haladaptatus sp. ZSTT2 TaxID=3120515 RepID=UPI00300F5299
MTELISRRAVLRTIGMGGLVLTMGSAKAGECGGVEILLNFDPGSGQLPENLAVDRRGNKYIGMSSLGELWKVPADNTTASPLAVFDIGAGFGVLGVTVTPQGTAFVCLLTGVGEGDDSADTHGIWKVERDGTKSLFAPLPPTTFPNDLMPFRDGFLVTDSTGGAVWYVTEGATTPWVTSELLEGTGSFGFGFPIGANGIVRGKDGAIYVGVAEQGHIVRIPVSQDGSAGTPELFVADDRIFGCDGITIDNRGNLYVAVIAQNTIVRVNTDKSVKTLATESDGLDSPSDVAFGTSGNEQKSLFITNFALLNTENPMPGLATLRVGIPGRPVNG